jgi:hypothetical protein
MLEGMTQLLGEVPGVFLVVLHADPDCANLVLRPSHAPDPTRFYCTNLREQDLILGSAAQRLDRLVRGLSTRHPEATIFLLGSCVSSLIGDEVSAAARRLQPEVTARLIPVPMRAFSLSGQSEILERFTRELGRLAPPLVEPEPRGINLIGFPPDGGDSAALLGERGIPVNVQLPLTAPLQRWRELGRGSLNVVSDARLFARLLAHLQAQHSIPWIEAPAPWGLAATDAFCQAITEAWPAGGDPADPRRETGAHSADDRSRAAGSRGQPEDDEDRKGAVPDRDRLEASLQALRRRTEGRRLVYHVGARKDFSAHTVVREGLAPLSLFEELDFEIELLFQGAPEGPARRRVAEVLDHLDVSHPFDMAPDRVSLTRLLRQRRPDLFYGSDSLHEEVERAAVPHLPIGALRPGPRGCLASWERIAALLPAGEASS